MCSGGSRSTPAPPPLLPEAPQLPEQPSVGKAGSTDRKRRAAATGNTEGGTILTGSRGVTQPGATATKTLLGE